MIKLATRYIKLLLLLLIDFLTRIKKICDFICTGKHEVERICESNTDIYEKCMSVDRWLTQTKCREVKSFLSRNLLRTTNERASLIKRSIEQVLSYADNRSKKGGGISHSGKKSRRKDTNVFADFEEGDIVLNSYLRDLSKELLRIISVSKHLKGPKNEKIGCLHDILYRILAYRVTVYLAEELAATKYDPELEDHTRRLISLWNNLVISDTVEESSNDRVKLPRLSKAFPSNLNYRISCRSDIVSSRWSHIGFQGEDPGTDFRGMGLLGLLQLEYLARKPKKLPSDLLSRSLSSDHGYPFAIVGINITFNLLNLFREGHMKHLYFDEGDVLFRNKERMLSIMKTFNDLYVELFLRFDCFWHQSKPQNIFEFKALMEKFVDIVKTDLSNRNFSMKFIY